MLMGATLSRPICHVLAYLYPAYMSFKAVRADDPDLHSQWLVYWIVNTAFTVGELFTDQLLTWVPAYYELKIAFVAWLVLPRFKGAAWIYSTLLAPYLTKYEAHIDAQIDHAAGQPFFCVGYSVRSSLSTRPRATSPPSDACEPH